MTSDIINGIYYAILNGARVINLSLGRGLSKKEKRLYRDPRNRVFVLQRLIRERNRLRPLYDRVLRTAEEAGVTVVVGAGNDNVPGDVGPLCFNRYTLCVGAVGLTREGALAPAPFSNYGHLVQVSAPGVYIVSGSAKHDGKGYIALGGTSMATPYVSGLAGLIASVKPDLHPRDIRLAIVATALSETPSGKARVRWVMREDVVGKELRRWMRAFMLLLGQTRVPDKLDSRLMQVLLSLIPDRYVQDWYERQIEMPKEGLAIGGKSVGGFIDAPAAIVSARRGDFHRHVFALDEAQMKLARKVKREDIVRVYELIGLLGSYAGSLKKNERAERVGPFELKMKAPYKRLEVVRKKDPGKGYAEGLEYVPPGRFRHFARYEGKDYSQGLVEVRRADEFLAVKNLKTGRSVSYVKPKGGVIGGLGGIFQSLFDMPTRRLRTFVPPSFCTIAWWCTGGTFSFRAFGTVGDKKHPLPVNVLVFSGKKKAAEGLYGSDFDFLLPPGKYRILVDDVYSGGGKEEFEVTLAEDKVVGKEVSFPKGALFLRIFASKGEPLKSHVHVYSGKKEVTKAIFAKTFGFLLSPGTYRVRVEDSSASTVQSIFEVAVEEGKVLSRDVRLARGTLLLRTFMAEGKPLNTDVRVYSGKDRIAVKYNDPEFKFLLSPGPYRVKVVSRSAQKDKKEFGVIIEEEKTVQRDVKLPKGTLIVRVFGAGGKPLKSHIYVFSGKEKVSQGLFRSEAKFLLRPGAYRIKVEDSSTKKKKKELEVIIEEGKIFEKKVPFS